MTLKVDQVLAMKATFELRNALCVVRAWQIQQRLSTLDILTIHVLCLAGAEFCTKIKYPQT